MTNAELKEALMDKRKVVFDGIEYTRVNAIIYRERNGNVIVTAELLDKNNDCVVIVPTHRIQEVSG